MSRDGAYAIALRWRDLDALGHVNYATYLTFLEEARDAWLTRTLGVKRGTEYVVAGVSIQYRSELTLADDPVSITVEVVTIGRSSLTTSERVFGGDGGVAAEAEVVIVFWDGDKRRSRPISPQERTLVEAGGRLTASA